MKAAVVNLDVERENAAIFARLKELLTQHPEIRERTFAALNGEIPMARNEESLTIRLDAALLDQLDKMVPVVAAMPEFAAVGKITRSMVARLAIMRGLEAMRKGDSDTAGRLSRT